MQQFLKLALALVLASTATARQVDFAYVRPRKEAARLLRAFRELPVGSERQYVIRTLGRPDHQTTAAAKESPAILGYRLRYYLKRVEHNSVNLRDEFLTLSFAPDGRLTSRSHVRGRTISRTSH